MTAGDRRRRRHWENRACAFLDIRVDTDRDKCLGCAEPLALDAADLLGELFGPAPWARP